MKSRIFVFILFIGLPTWMSPQCPVDNNYFQAGEELTYDLYFKYGLINTKAGLSTLKTIQERYDNRDALKMTIIAQSVGMAAKLFSLSDTLKCYMTKKLVPLAYIKSAHEGNEYSKEHVSYDYSSSGVTIKAKLIRNGKWALIKLSILKTTYII